MKYQPTIGLEIHVQLNTESKMFCSSPNAPDEKEPNINVCPVCMGHPGTLPVINKKAVERVILTGLALNCKISKTSKFDRKNYFYPDLPKGYQISQYDMPLCQSGYLKIDDSKTGITRIHLEEDTGRLVHSKKGDVSFIDFNRAGVPLMELVTDPDIKSGKQARQFCEELQLILRYLGVSDADMEKGEMRCEVNISLMPANLSPASLSLQRGEQISQMNDKKNSDISGQISENSRGLGTKVEIKNLNSFKAVERAIEYEIGRQSDVLESKKKVIQETRGWNEKKQITVSQRTKEGAQDYRYFPEPDLPLLLLAPSVKNKLDYIDIKRIKGGLPELPQARKERFQKEYNLPDKDIKIFVVNKKLGDYFENVISELKNWMRHGADAELKSIRSQTPSTKGIIIQERLYKLSANYLITELQKLMSENRQSIRDIKITPENFAEFIVLAYRGVVSSSGAQEVLKEMIETGADPSHIIKDKKLEQVSSKSEVEGVIDKVIKDNPGPIADYKKGKENALQFLVGQAMKESRGKANPQVARELLVKKIHVT